MVFVGVAVAVRGIRFRLRGCGVLARAPFFSVGGPRHLPERRRVCAVEVRESKAEVIDGARIETDSGN